MKKGILVLLIGFFISACGIKNNAAPPDALPPQSGIVQATAEASGGISAAPSPTVPAISEKEAFIKNIISGMSLEEKIGQTLFLSFETDEAGGALTKIDDKTIEALKKFKPGGIIYFASNIDTSEQTQKLSKTFQENSEMPLFIATDEEGGRVSRITRSGKIDAAIIPPAKEIGNTGERAKAYEAALTISQELKALGINMDFAPCADLNEDNQGVIGDRAYSGSPDIAGEFVCRAIEGFAEGGVICSIKHFPGHGAAPGDTHEEEIVSEKSLEEILSSDVMPFQMGIENGAPMVMVSHITVPEWGVPSSLSADAVNLLRDEMGFEGVIITDALRMGAIVNYYSSGEASVMAAKAGVDILLMPGNYDEAFEALVNSVISGEINAEKIDESVFRILSLKYDYGLFDY